MRASPPHGRGTINGPCRTDNDALPAPGIPYRMVIQATNGASHAGIWAGRQPCPDTVREEWTKMSRNGPAFRIPTICVGRRAQYCLPPIWASVKRECGSMPVWLVGFPTIRLAIIIGTTLRPGQWFPMAIPSHQAPARMETRGPARNSHHPALPDGGCASPQLSL